jgi:PAS domain S-box-containing protein
LSGKQNGLDVDAAMSDQNRIELELLEELERLRARVAYLEQAENAHRRADAELQDTLVFLEGIVDTAHEGLLVLDSELRVKRANRSFYQVFEAKQEETENQFIYELGNGQWNIPKLRGLLENLLKENTEVRDFEVQHSFQDIGQKTMLVNARQLFHPDRNINMILVAINDITERKQAEESMEQYARELTRSNEELEQFAYVASHDLQEPLRMVTSYLQLLERRYKYRLDPDADKFIDYAVDGAARMKTLITDLLAFSRVGSSNNGFTRTDANAVLARVLTNLRPLIEETRAEIISDELPMLMADGGQLVQVFQNLLHNGIKFRGEREPIVTIRCEQKDGNWVFSVKDNGIGIEPQYLDRVFLLFRRLHGLREYPGTGIGLAICRKIIERHGGRIWVESTPGEGSTFYFTIPIEPAQEKA